MQKIGFCQALSPAVFQTIVKHCIKDEESLSRSNLPKPSFHDKGQKSANNILFIDDISMASGDPTSRYAQPTLEVLRQMISEGWSFHSYSNRSDVSIVLYCLFLLMCICSC